GHILAGLRAREDPRGADAFEGGLDVQWVLPDEHSREGSDQRNAALGGVRRFALTDDALIGVNPDVRLVAVHPHFGRANLCDLQFGTAILARGLLDGGAQRSQSRHARNRQQPAVQQSSAIQSLHEFLLAQASSLEAWALLTTRRRIHPCETPGPSGGFPQTGISSAHLR